MNAGIVGTFYSVVVVVDTTTISILCKGYECNSVGLNCMYCICMYVKLYMYLTLHAAMGMLTLRNGTRSS